MRRRVDAPSSRPIRHAVVAGSFYPADPDRLRALVRDQLVLAARLPGVRRSATHTLPLGLLVPHAGIAFSGVTAAAGWMHLGVAPDDAMTVVLLGTNHGATWLDGVGVWNSGTWETPLGAVEVDAGVAAAVVELGRPFGVDLDAHELEHSLEVQLPALQTVAPAARIVPLAVSCGRGPTAVDAGERLGALLRQRRAVGERIVLAISTDLAHYPPHATCARATETLVPPILALDSAHLADVEASMRATHARGMSCGMCGIEPAVLGLAALRAMGATIGTRLASATSAEAGGPPDRAVGYLSVRFDA
jgi:hypothetical protein